MVQATDRERRAELFDHPLDDFVRDITLHSAVADERQCEGGEERVFVDHSNNNNGVLLLHIIIITYEFFPCLFAAVVFCREEGWFFFVVVFIYDDDAFLGFTFFSSTF